MADVESKITKSVSYQFANLLISGLVGVFFIPFIISSIGKTQYGIFEMVFSLNIINSVLDIGVGSTIENYSKKYYEEGRDHFSNFFWTYFWFKVGLSIIGCIICIILAVNTELIFTKIDPNEIVYLKYSIIWFAVGILIQNINSFLNGVQNGFVRYDMTSFANIISRVFYMIGFFIWLYSFEENTIIEFCFLTFVLVPISKLLVQLIQMYIYLPDLLSKPQGIRLFYLKDTINYLGGISFITIFAQLFNSGTQTMLAFLATPAIVAEFGVLKRVMKLVKRISQMMVRPVMPAAQDLKKKYSVKDIILKGTKVHSIVVTGLVFLILVNAEIISIYYLQSEFSSFPLHLFIFAFPVLTPSFAIMLMLYYNEGKSKMSVQYNIINTTLSLMLAYIGLEYYGLIGFLIGLVVGFSLCTIIQTFRFIKYFEIRKKDFFFIYLKRYLTLILCFSVYFSVKYYMGISISSAIIWNIIITGLLAGFSWMDIGKRLKQQLLSKISI